MNAYCRATRVMRQLTIIVPLRCAEAGLLKMGAPSFGGGANLGYMWNHAIFLRLLRWQTTTHLYM